MSAENPNEIFRLWPARLPGGFDEDELVATEALQRSALHVGYDSFGLGARSDQSKCFDLGMITICFHDPHKWHGEKCDDWQRYNQTTPANEGEAGHGEMGLPVIRGWNRYRRCYTAFRVRRCGRGDRDAATD